MQKNRLIRKMKVKFGIYDVTAWEMNNCNTHIAQYLKKEKQSDDENRSINRI